MNAIVYTSETGHTARYAALLAEQTGLPAYSLQEAEAKLNRGEPVFYLGWLMAGSTKGYQEAKKAFALQGVACVGMARSPNGFLWSKADKSSRMVDGARIFYLQGGYDGTQLHGLDRAMMKAFEKRAFRKLAEKPDRTPEEEDTLSILRDNGDRVCPENLREILDWMRQEGVSQN